MFDTKDDIFQKSLRLTHSQILFFVVQLLAPHGFYNSGIANTPTYWSLQEKKAHFHFWVTHFLFQDEFDRTIIQTNS